MQKIKLDLITIDTSKEMYPQIDQDTDNNNVNDATIDSIVPSLFWNLIDRDNKYKTLNLPI